MNLAGILTAATKANASRTAVKLDALELSYELLDQAAARVAGFLAERGVAAGDRVGVMLPNLPYFPACYYGVLRLGAIVVPMNVLLKPREIRFYLSDSEAKVLFAWHDFAEAAEAGARDSAAECVFVAPGDFEAQLAAAPLGAKVVERDGFDTAVILYTSGTTGTPKGAELTHSNLAKNAELAVDIFDLGSEATTLGALPLFHSFGQTCALNATIKAGACLTLIPRFEAGKALQIIERDRVTVFEGVPTMYAAMLNHPERRRFDASSLQVCVSGGASLPVEVMRGFEEAFGCKVLEGYGLSETSPAACFNHPDLERKPGSIGTPVAGVEMKIVDDRDRVLRAGEVGEIVIRGHNVMKRYWRQPEATTKAIRDGWFHTGDMARVDEDGYFFVVDRKKDLIIRGGYNVYPREVEEVLYEHPAVREAAVIGLPDKQLGEEVAAVVALKDGSQCTSGELIDFAKAQVAAYKYPRHVWFVDELPKGPTGKILKREIATPAAAARVGDRIAQVGAATEVQPLPPSPRRSHDHQGQ